MKRNFWLLLVFGILALLVGIPKAPAAPAPHFKKVMIVIFENMDYDAPLERPFFTKLANEGALLSNFYAETHPSQPNYIALVSGSTHGVTGDGNVDLDARHLGDLLEAKGKQWKTYAEAYPGGCFTKAQSKTYVRKHVPFMSFRNVQASSQRCGRIVNSADLQTDLKNGTLPDFSLYIPDLNNDGHDTNAKYADGWFAKAFGPLIANRELMKDLLIIATFDESSLFGGNHIYTAFYGAGVRPGAVSNMEYSHYSILRTIEDEFGLDTLGLNDVKASAITDIWR